MGTHYKLLSNRPKLKLREMSHEFSLIEDEEDFSNVGFRMLDGLIIDLSFSDLRGLRDNIDLILSYFEEQ